MNDLLQHNVELFFGECTAALGRVYGRLPYGPLADALPITQSQFVHDYQLTARIVGPHSPYANTLTAAITMQITPRDDAWTLQVAVPDPCFWQPDEPFLYRVQGELRHIAKDNVVCAQARWDFGFRPLGAKQNSLYLAGKRWVPRGWAPNPLQAVAAAEAHAASLALVSLGQLAESQLADSARVGVLQIAVVEPTTTPQETAALERGHFPAVGIIAFADGAAPLTADYKYGNAVLAQWLRPHQLTQRASWAQAIILQIEDVRQLSNLPPLALPMLIYRPAQQIESCEQARSACDLLQRDAACFGDFAGFLV